MKKILLPTDFSDNARNAMKYAFELFGKAVYQDEVEFIVLHIHPTVSAIPSPAPYFANPRVISDEEIKELDDRLAEECADFEEQYPKQRIKKELIAGISLEAIIDFIKETNIDLIVMGTKGASRLERLVMGSMALGVCQKAPCSVLVIPEKARFKSLERVLFSTDFRNLENLDILAPLHDVVEAYEARIFTLHIFPKKKTVSKEKEAINRMLNEYFDSKSYSHFFLEHDNPAEGIEEFIRGYRADILTLIGQERSFFENLFHRSVTKQLLFHSDIPVFVLNSTTKEKDPSIKDDIKTQVDKWRANVEELNVQLHLGKVEASEKFEEHKGKAQKKLKEIKARLEKAEDIAEDKWDHFKKEMSDALDHLKKAFVG